MIPNDICSRSYNLWVVVCITRLLSLKDHLVYLQGISNISRLTTPCHLTSMLKLMLVSLSLITPISSIIRSHFTMVSNLHNHKSISSRNFVSLCSFSLLAFSSMSLILLFASLSSLSLCCILNKFSFSSCSFLRLSSSCSFLNLSYFSSCFFLSLSSRLINSSLRNFLSLSSSFASCSFLPSLF